MADLAAFSILQSEESKSKERHHTDTFPAFAAKCKMILDAKAADKPKVPSAKSRAPCDRMGLLVSAGVRYNGASVNRSMFSAILLFGDKLCEESVATLRRIERLAGREC